jgi:hypothetical protein
VSDYEKKLIANAMARIQKLQLLAPGKPSQPDFDSIFESLDLMVVSQQVQ